jgi:hypothetical protein
MINDLHAAPVSIEGFFFGLSAPVLSHFSVLPPA